MPQTLWKTLWKIAAKGFNLSALFLCMLGGITFEASGEVCCRNAESMGCTTSASRAVCETTGGEWIYSGPCTSEGGCAKGGAGNPPPPVPPPGDGGGGESCSATARTGPIQSTTGADYFEDNFSIEDAGSCRVEFSGEAGGVSFPSSTLNVPLSGFMPLSLMRTSQPSVYHVMVADTSGLEMHSFLMAGHTIRITHIDLIKEDFLLDTSRQINNVSGPYLMRFQLTVDEGDPVILYESGNMLATFDASGEWLKFLTTGTFFFSPIDMPTLAPAALILLAFSLGISGIAFFKRKQNKFKHSLQEME